MLLLLKGNIHILGFKVMGLPQTSICPLGRRARDAQQTQLAGGPYTLDNYYWQEKSSSREEHISGNL
jgi:hypothetical protein